MRMVAKAFSQSVVAQFGVLQPFQMATPKPFESVLLDHALPRHSGHVLEQVETVVRVLVKAVGKEGEGV